MTTETNVGERLRSFVERIERLTEEKSELATDITEVYAELKGTGFNAKIVRMIIRLRTMEDADRQEQEMFLETYLTALGMSHAANKETDDEPAES